MPDHRERTLYANGIGMHVVEQGEGYPVILLHGFPELAYFGIAFLPRGREPITQALKRYPDNRYNYILYFQEPGRAEREIEPNLPAWYPSVVSQYRKLRPLGTAGAAGAGERGASRVPRLAGAEGWLGYCVVQPLIMSKEMRGSSFIC